MTIIPAIAYLVTEKLPGLIGIGQCFAYYPLESTGVLAKAAFTAANQINLCIVTRPTAQREYHASYYTYQQPLRLEFRRTYSNAQSQAAHDALLDAVLTALTADDTLNGTVAEVLDVRLVRNEAQFFYKWLVHYGEILVSVRVS